MAAKGTSRPVPPPPSKQSGSRPAHAEADHRSAPASKGSTKPVPSSKRVNPHSADRFNASDSSQDQKAKVKSKGTTTPPPYH